MPDVLDRIAQARPGRPAALQGEVVPRRRSSLDYASMLESYSFGGNAYSAVIGSGIRTEERIEANFRGLVEGAYKRHGPVFACMVVRMLAFSEARFMYRQLRSGRPGDLFSTSPANGGDLDILRRPWRGGTTGDLLTRMIVDADVAGNAFVARRPNRLRRLRPDWMTIVLGSIQDAETLAGRVITGDDLDADVLGYIYGPDDGSTPPEVLMPDEVAHFAPIPDPMANYRGMSWLTPIIREVAADQGATTHKLKFFERGAALQVVVSLDKDVPVDAFDEFVTRFRASHEGVDNSYKTLFLGGGAQVTTVTANMQEIEMKALQGVSETRIAAAARVHPVVVGFSEGLAGSSLNAGNYRAAVRNFADLTMRPLWRNAAGSLESIIAVPTDAELWYDDRDIAFLREDAKDAAEIFQQETTSYRTLVDAGVNPDAAGDAVASQDIRRVVGQHSGLFSVQLQKPVATAPPADGSSNGAQPAIAAGR